VAHDEVCSKVTLHAVQCSLPAYCSVAMLCLKQRMATEGNVTPTKNTACFVLLVIYIFVPVKCLDLFMIIRQHFLFHKLGRKVLSYIQVNMVWDICIFHPSSLIIQVFSKLQIPYLYPSTWVSSFFIFPHTLHFTIGLDMNNIFLKIYMKGIQKGQFVKFW